VDNWVGSRTPCAVRAALGFRAAAYSVHGSRSRLIVRRSRMFAAIAVCAAIVLAPSRLFAVETRVTQLRITGTRVWVAFEVRDLLRDKFLKLLRDGRAVFLQLEANVWEDRRVLDRVIIAAPLATWRVDQEANSGILLQDHHGGSVDDAGTYYVHARLTAATVDERDIEQAGQALFGDDQTTQGLAGLGRFVFRTLLRMGKYFESATAETTSRRVSGKDIRTGAF
jgi:hypothetical protein